VACHKGVELLRDSIDVEAEALTLDTRNINYLSFFKVRDGGKASQVIIIVPMQDGYHRGSGDNL
jgi:hypothetical protein